VPIYDATTRAVVGFGYVATWSAEPDYYTRGPNGQIDYMTSPWHLQMTRLPLGRQLVGYGNVSGVVVPGIPQDTGPQYGTSFNTIFQENANSLINPLYAPVLVNRYIGPNPSNP
jgi:hypothetical protein